MHVCVLNAELRLHLGYRLLRFTSRMNLESVPRFAEICCSLSLPEPPQWRKGILAATTLCQDYYNFNYYYILSRAVLKICIINEKRVKYIISNPSKSIVCNRPQ